MSSKKYIPPYKVSEEAVNLIAEISAAVERFDIEISGVKGVRLLKTNRIKTIHGSTAIFGKWRSAFYAAPIAHIVWENQSGYYLAIRRSTLLGNSEPFIDFMLERILQAIKGKGEELKNVGVNVGVKLSARARSPGTVASRRNIDSCADSRDLFNLNETGRAAFDRSQEKGIPCPQRLRQGWTLGGRELICNRGRKPWK